MSLYHRDVFMPQWIGTPVIPFAFNVSKHAEEACKNDRYGKIELPDIFVPSEYSLFEVETNGNKIIKAAFEGRYKNKKITFVFKRRTRREVWTLATVWLNAATDVHATLDIINYAWA